MPSFNVGKLRLETMIFTLGLEITVINIENNHPEIKIKIRHSNVIPSALFVVTKLAFTKLKSRGHMNRKPERAPTNGSLHC